MKSRGWIIFSGGLWVVMGTFLLQKGLHFISDARFVSDSISMKFQGFFGSASQAGSVILVLGLVIGFLKSRFVFSKSVKRVVDRIRSLPSPIRFTQVYAPSYWIIIGSMMMLGMVFRYLPIPIDLRGFIDVAIGSALINGGMQYFRFAREKKMGAESDVS